MIAERLYVSSKTVEANLCLPKLDVHSRAELALAMTARVPAVEP